MSALGSAISGLQTSQKWLDVISNNVSNSQTVAYKGSRANFSDLISDGIRSASGPDAASNLGGLNPSQLGLGVTVSSVQILEKQGATQVTGNASDVAIQGAGYLTVTKGAETLYTRAGNLTFDQQGNLVTSDGGLVQGWQMKTTRNPVAPGPMTLIQSKLDTSSPAAIGKIQIPNNLVLAPKATSSNASPTVKTQGVILKGNLDNNTPANAAPLPCAGAAPTAVQLAAFTPDATTVFTVYDSLGTSWTFTMLWQQRAATPGTQAQWQWTMYYTPNGAAPNAAATFAPLPTPGAWVGDSSGGIVGATSTNNSATTAALGVRFNPDGSLLDNGTTGPVFSNVLIGLAIPNGAVGPGGAAGTLNFSINMGTENNPAAVPPTYGLRDGLTGDYGSGSFDPLTGVYVPKQTAYTAFVDGYAEGTLTGLSFNQTGGINCTFSNNQTVEVAKVAMSKFANQEGLERTGGNYFRQTGNSGLAQIGTAGSEGFGTIAGGALEASNVDLTIELTNMILAHRMFESNARVVTSADKVLDTLVNLGR